MMDMFQIMFGAIFINNFILMKFLGLCPFIGVSKRLSSAIWMGLAVSIVMLISTFLTYIVNEWILRPFGIRYMQVVIFILIIASVVQVLEILIKRYSPGLHSLLGIYLPLIATHCAIIGVCLINVGKGYALLESLVNSIGAGLGFILALLIMAGIRERLDSSIVPEPFRGVPLAFIVSSMLSMTFTIFRGMQ